MDLSRRIFLKKTGAATLGPQISNTAEDEAFTAEEGSTQNEVEKVIVRRDGTGVSFFSKKGGDEEEKWKITSEVLDLLPQKHSEPFNSLEVGQELKGPRRKCYTIPLDGGKILEEHFGEDVDPYLFKNIGTARKILDGGYQFEEQLDDPYLFEISGALSDIDEQMDIQKERHCPNPEIHYFGEDYDAKIYGNKAWLYPDEHVPTSTFSDLMPKPDLNAYWSMRDTELEEFLEYSFSKDQRVFAEIFGPPSNDLDPEYIY